jgi:hypothetical protein
MPTGLNDSVRGYGMKKSFWNSWKGFLTQMILFAFLGLLGALAVGNLLGY